MQFLPQPRLIVIVVEKMIDQYESNKQPNHNFTILELGLAPDLGHLDHGLRPSNIEGPQILSGKLVFLFFFIFFFFIFFYN